MIIFLVVVTHVTSHDATAVRHLGSAILDFTISAESQKMTVNERKLIQKKKEETKCKFFVAVVLLVQYRSAYEMNFHSL